MGVELRRWDLGERLDFGGKRDGRRLAEEKRRMAAGGERRRRRRGLTLAAC